MPYAIVLGPFRVEMPTAYRNDRVFYRFTFLFLWAVRTVAAVPSCILSVACGIFGDAKYCIQRRKALRLYNHPAIEEIPHSVSE